MTRARAPRWWPTFSLAAKELRQIGRDPRSLVVLLGLPTMLLFLFGYALSLDVEHVPLGACDLDRSPESRELLRRFTTSGYFDLVAAVDRPSDLDPLLDRGEARVGLVLPRGFGRAVREGRGATVQALLDGADSNQAAVVRGYVEVILRRYGDGALADFLAAGSGVGPSRGPRIALDSRVWYNPELRSILFFVPGLIGIGLMATTMIMTSLAMVRERERGTLEGLLATPLRPAELVIGKTVPYALLAFADACLALATGVFWFEVPFNGSVALLLALTLDFLLAGLGLGLLVSTLAETQQSAWSLGVLTTLLPSFILSGFIFPVESMPRAAQLATALVPARYYLEILRGVILKGVGLEALWPQALALAAFAATFLGVAARRVRKQLG